MWSNKKDYLRNEQYVWLLISLTSHFILWEFWEHSVNCFSADNHMPQILEWSLHPAVGISLSQLTINITASCLSLFVINDWKLQTDKVCPSIHPHTYTHTHTHTQARARARECNNSTAVNWLLSSILTTTRRFHKTVPDIHPKANYSVCQWPSVWKFQ